MSGSTTVRGLLVRGMLAGLVAGVLAFVFAKLFGEPQLDKAIAYEDASGAPLVSRELQSTLGLLTATVVYGVALGGIFGLVFAAAYGRVGASSARATAAGLAAVGFVVIFLVPFTKYPSNPPAVGAEETIGGRTEIYFAMIGISLAAAIAALRVRRDLTPRLGAWNGTLAAVAAFVVLIAIAQVLMPSLDEVPSDFPASVLWHFRVSTLGMQLVIWATLGLGFGAIAQRFLSR